MLHSLRQDMLVETPADIDNNQRGGKEQQEAEPGEVALQQLVVIDGLGDHPANKLEVAKVVGVDVAEVVDCVGHLMESKCEKELKD